MTFPSLWGVIGTIVLFVSVCFALSWMASSQGGDERKKADSAQRLGPAMEAATYFLPPSLFWAITGNFPFMFSAVALVVWLAAISIAWTIKRVAGADREVTAIEQQTITGLFLPARLQTISLVLSFVFLIVWFGALWLAFDTAKKVDLQSAPGLFQVAMWLFFWPSVANALLNWPARLWLLISRRTPRIVRSFQFTMLLRHFIIAVWSVSYPFFAFQQTWLSAEPTYLAFGAICVAFAYLALVIGPFEMGRLRFAQRERATLDRLQSNSDGVLIATDPTVGETYRTEMMKQLLASMREDQGRLEKECPFPSMTDDAKAKAVKEQNAEAATFLWYDPAHRRRLDQLDYRLFALRSLTGMTRADALHEEVRGHAMHAERGASKRLLHRESKSILVATVGVALAFLVPLLQREYEGEIRGAVHASRVYLENSVTVIRGAL